MLLGHLGDQFSGSCDIVQPLGGIRAIHTCMHHIWAFSLFEGKGGESRRGWFPVVDFVNI